MLIDHSLLRQRPLSDNVRIRKRLSRGTPDTTPEYSSDGALLSAPPSLQTMDRGTSHWNWRGSESDFTSLSSYRSSSLIDSEHSYCSSEENIKLYGLPTIHASPIEARSKFQLDELPIPPLTSTTKTQSFIVFGWDMTTYTRRSQFLISAGGTFAFSIIYAYLQELISVELCHRKLGLFLAAVQFGVYATLSFLFRSLDKSTNSASCDSKRVFFGNENQSTMKNNVPLGMYLGLSMLRAIDLGMTNLAMQYVNYPAKTLMKSTRIVFTMLFGVIVTKKRYGLSDYGIVMLMVAGLGIFMHADSKSSAVFQPLGVVMLTISLLCDGAISNVSEATMNRYQVGHDDFIFRLYGVAFFFVSIAAVYKGDLRDGLVYLTQAGTLKEIEEDLDPTWSISAKFLTLVLFSTTGYLSSSCSAAITKSFGALTMSITSTARKAATIFLSFALFPNECTLEHIFGIVLFIGSLIGKSMRASRHSSRHKKGKRGHQTMDDVGVGSPAYRTAPGVMRRKNVENVV